MLVVDVVLVLVLDVVLVVVVDVVVVVVLDVVLVVVVDVVLVLAVDVVLVVVVDVVLVLEVDVVDVVVVVLWIVERPKNIAARPIKSNARMGIDARQQYLERIRQNLLLRRLILIYGFAFEIDIL